MKSARENRKTEKTEICWVSLPAGGIVHVGVRDNQSTDVFPAMYETRSAYFPGQFLPRHLGGFFSGAQNSAVPRQGTVEEDGQIFGENPE